MRLRNTLAAAAIFAGLAAWIYFYEYRGEERREEAARAERRALPFETEAVRSLSLVKPDGAIRLAKDGAQWRLLEPFEARADEEQVSGLLTTLSLLEFEDRIDAGSADFGRYNLETPPLEVTVGLEGDPSEGSLALGDRAPIGSVYYARRGDSGPVLTVSSSVERLLDATADGLRYRKIVGIDSWKVEEFRIEGPGPSIAFAREREEWRIVSPVAFPADRVKVLSLLYDLTTLTATGFESAGTKPEAVGLVQPRFRLLVTPEEGDPVAVEFSGAGEDGSVRVRREGMPEIFRMDRQVLEKLDLEEQDYRDARVAPIDRWQLAEMRAREAGDERAVLKDAESNWRWGSLDGPVLARDAVESLIDALEEVRAVAYRDGGDAAAGIGADGQGLVLDLRAGEGSPVRLRFGSDVGDRVLVSSSIASAVYEVERTAVEKLLDAVRSLEEPAATAASPVGPGSEGSS